MRFRLFLLVGLVSLVFGACAKMFPDDVNKEHFSFYRVFPGQVKGEISPVFFDSRNKSEYVLYDTIDNRTRAVIYLGRTTYLYYWLDNPPKIGVTYRIPESNVLFLCKSGMWEMYLDEDATAYMPLEGTFKFRTLKQEDDRLTVGLEGDCKLGKMLKERSSIKQIGEVRYYGTLHHTQFVKPYTKKTDHLEWRGVKSSHPEIFDKFVR